MLVKKMEQAAENKGIEGKIDAMSVNACEDAAKRAQAGQHGGACPGAAHRAAHLRRGAYRDYSFCRLKFTQRE